jgi:hypothetical protein
LTALERLVGYRALAEKINKKNKNANVKDFMVKNHVWIFLNCSIEKPDPRSSRVILETASMPSLAGFCDLLMRREAPSGRLCLLQKKALLS